MKRRSLLLGGLVASAAAVFGVKPAVPVQALPAIEEAYDDGDAWDDEDEYADDYSGMSLDQFDGVTTSRSSAAFIPMIWSQDALVTRTTSSALFTRITPGTIISFPESSNITWSSITEIDPVA